MMPASRGVAQSGSALGWGPSGRRFKSCRPDQFSTQTNFRSGISSEATTHGVCLHPLIVISIKTPLILSNQRPTNFLPTLTSGLAYPQRRPHRYPLIVISIKTPLFVDL